MTSTPVKLLEKLVSSLESQSNSLEQRMAADEKGNIMQQPATAERAASDEPRTSTQAVDLTSEWMLSGQTCHNSDTHFLIVKMGEIFPTLCYYNSDTEVMFYFQLRYQGH